MSLINDMLRDIDERETTPLASDSVKAEIPEKMGLAIVAIKLFKFSSLILAFFIAISLWNHVNIDQIREQASGGDSLVPALEAAPDERENSTDIDLHQLAVKSNDEKSTGNLAAVATAGASANKSDVEPKLKGSNTYSSTSGAEVAQVSLPLYLAKANQALKNTQLTLPANASAIFFFNKVLAADSNNALAKEGLEKVKDTYSGILQDALDKGELARARQLLSRAALVNFSETEISRYQEQLATMAIRVASSEEDKASLTSSGKELESLSIVKTEASSEKALLRKVKSLHAAKEYRNAERELTSYLQLNPQASSVRIALFDLYIAEKNVAAAQDLTEQTKSMSPVLFNYFNARLFANEGAIIQAFDMIKDLPRKSITDSAVLAYRAALAQRLKNNTLAIADYRELVQSSPMNSTYWLGLAVSLDAEGDGVKALESFATVKKLGNLPQNVLLYVDERIRLLSAQKVAGVAKW